MRKFFKVIVVIFLVILLLGCNVKNENTITILDDGSMIFEVTLGFDSDARKKISEVNVGGSNSFDYFLEKYLPEYVKDFSVSKYDNGTYVGNKYSYVVSDIDTICSDKENTVIVNDNNKVSEKKLFYKKNGVYYANLVFDLNKKYNNYDGVNVETTFVVNLPRKAINSNADNISNDGKTLKWNIDMNSQKEIQFSFAFADYSLYLSIGFVIFDLILIIVIAYFFVRRRKRKI